MDRKRILVTGGGGLIGSHLCRRLLAQGHEVICMDLADRGEAAGLHDLMDNPSFEYVCRSVVEPFNIDVSQIYNLASPTSPEFFRRYPVETMRVNLLGCMNTLDLARLNNADYLYASSGDVYGFSRMATYGESYGSGVNPSDVCTPAADGKRAGESLCRAYIYQHRLRARVPRIFNTYGPGVSATDDRVVPQFIFNALHNKDIVIWGSGEQTRTFCWVEDTVDGLVRMMEWQGMRGFDPINIGSSREISIRALAERIISLSGSRSRIVHLHAKGGDPRQKTPEITKARVELGWEPAASLDYGLKRTIEYFGRILSADVSRILSWAEIN